MEVVIFIVLYILVGCVIDLLITRGEEKPCWIIAMIWPAFLVISAIIMAVELREDDVDDEKIN